VSQREARRGAHYDEAFMRPCCLRSRAALLSADALAIGVAQAPVEVVQVDIGRMPLPGVVVEPATGPASREDV
jgi:hypothetical protein